MLIQTSSATYLGTVAMAEVLDPPPTLNFVEWAERNIVFSDRESPFPGPYNRTMFPYFDAVLAALSPNDPCRVVTLKKSAQIGGTVVANIFTLGASVMDPSDFLYVHPTDDNGRRWSKMKLSPMMRNTASVREVFPQKSRDGSDSVMYKERADGRGAIQISGANSPASLSQVSMKRQAQDDLSKWEMNLAGDPETQADSRSRAYEFAKVFKISTPLVLPGCRISRNFDAGSQEHFYLPCPHCGHFQTLEWENMLAASDADHPELACFSCIECGSLIEEHHRPGMLARWECRPHNPTAMREHRSFYIWSAYSYLQSFERIFREWLAAKGDPAAEQTFLNDTVGRAYQTVGESRPWQELRDRAAASEYKVGTVPPGGLVIFVGVDCQIDRVEWQAVAFGRDRRRYVIAYGLIPGHISEKKAQESLDGLLKQTWLNSARRPIGVEMLAIDGNAWTEDVWDWAKRHPSSKVIMVRGVGNDSAPLLTRVKRETNLRTGKRLKYSSRFYNFGTSVLKMALYRNLAKDDPLARGYVAFPAGLDDEYFRMLTAERRAGEKRHGFTVYRWVKDATQANEALDNMLQAEAAAIRWGVRNLPDEIWARLEAERETPVSAAQLELEDLIGAPVAPAAPATQKKPRGRRVLNRGIN